MHTYQTHQHHPCPCRVVIKGGDRDDAVVCTQDKTYALKYVETTNLLLLIPPNEVGVSYRMQTTQQNY